MPSKEWQDAVKGMTCACVRDNALDCAQARYGDTDEPCECMCHDLEEAEAALADFERNGGTTLEDLKTELGLK